MPRIFFIFLLSFLLLEGPSISAQNQQEKYLMENMEERSFDDEKYTELTKEVDFTEEKEKKKKEKKSDSNISPAVF